MASLWLPYVMTALTKPVAHSFAHCARLTLSDVTDTRPVMTFVASLRIHSVGCVYAGRCVYAPDAAFTHMCLYAGVGAYTQVRAYTHPRVRIRG
jgi:hypothetical protein